MVFIDSGAWIALNDRKDQYHKFKLEHSHAIRSR